MGRRRTYKPKNYEAIENKGTVFASIHVSMIQSNAWLQLTNNSRVLYLYLKLQQYGQKSIEGRDERCFYFNKALYMKKYKLYTNAGQFRKDRDMLIKYGFIECVENGEFTRTKNIYRYSDRWKSI